MTRARLVVAAAIVAVLLAAGGFLLGRFTASTEPTPVTGSAAAGFLRDMQVHHAQAVELAMLIRDRTDDPDLRQLAYDIVIGQSGQAGQMYGLLEAWGLPQAGGEPMSWMALPATDGSDAGEHGGMGSEDAATEMPGMVTDEQLDELEASSGVEAERLFLTLMIAHHRGGVEMAEAVLARSTVPEVVSMANGIVASQQSDIAVMQRMLDAR